MFDRAKILKNVKKPEEKLWFAKALEQAYCCIRSYEPCFTDFSNPFQIGELISLLGYNPEFKSVAFGGFEGCERVMAGFFPEYMEIDESLFPIRAIKISYNEKFSAKLSHRDFLGSVLGLGLTRDKVGDIIIEDGYAILLVKSDIADFILTNLERVAHTKVKNEEISLESLKGREEKGEEKAIIVSSLRVDAVLSGAFNLSRGKISELIAGGRAFVNWKEEPSASKNVNEGDIITLRGTGRIKIIEIKGKTKKDRFVLNIHKYN